MPLGKDSIRLNRPKYKQLELDLIGAGYRERERGFARFSTKPPATPFQTYTALLRCAVFIQEISSYRVIRKGISLPVRAEARTIARHMPDLDELRRIVERGMDYRPPVETRTIPEPPRMPHL